MVEELAKINFDWNLRINNKKSEIVGLDLVETHYLRNTISELTDKRIHSILKDTARSRMLFYRRK